MKKKVYVSYRDEFSAELEAEGNTEEELVKDAINKFEESKCVIKCSGNLWPEYFAVLDAVTEHNLRM